MKPLLVLLFGMLSSHAALAEYEVIQLYSQDELNRLISINKHLNRVKDDECQLVEDIKAHAIKVKEPSYAFLWGDMLAWGVCVERNPELGMHYITLAAKQGLLPAIEQLGRYYERGTLVEVDKERAINYYREAALQGFLKAKLNYTRLLVEGYGSPVDYEEAYASLYHSVIANKYTQQQANELLTALAQKMPSHIVEHAQKEKLY